MHSTNYSKTLICPAEDCRAVAKVPDKPDSVAALQYAMIAESPYALTSDDVLSTVAAQRKQVDQSDLPAFRTEYFSKGQPCFRASPLTKTHGWAVHFDGNGLVALVSPTTKEFADLCDDETVKKVAAMRNKRA